MSYCLFLIFVSPLPPFALPFPLLIHPSEALDPHNLFNRTFHFYFHLGSLIPIHGSTITAHSRSGKWRLMFRFFGATDQLLLLRGYNECRVSLSLSLTISLLVNFLFMLLEPALNAKCQICNLIDGSGSVER